MRILTKSAENPNQCIKPLCFTKTARNAFQIILTEIDFSEGKKLLLPAYIGITDREGSGVFDPVLNTKTPHEFYALDLRLSAKKTDLHEKIASGDFAAVLIIHYFGFCQNDMEEITRLCRENNVLIIEDCAHSLLSENELGGLGSIGDFGFYSLHKILAVKDGGMLRVNNPRYKRLIESNPARLPSAQTLEDVSRADHEAIKKKRRENYTRLATLMQSGFGYEVMYPKLPPGIVPHNFPVLIAEGKREKVYFELIAKNVPAVALYYRMIAPIVSGKYEDSIAVSGSILNLPVHQDITLNDIDDVASVFLAVMNSI